MLASHTVLPSIEEESLSVLPDMHQKSSQEFLFVVTLLGTHAQVVHGRGQPTFDEPVQDVTHTLDCVVFIFAGTCPQRDRLLLPMLEGL